MSLPPSERVSDDEELLGRMLQTVSLQLILILRRCELLSPREMIALAKLMYATFDAMRLRRALQDGDNYPPPRSTSE